MPTRPLYLRAYPKGRSLRTPTAILCRPAYGVLRHDTGPAPLRVSIRMLRYAAATCPTWEEVLARMPDDLQARFRGEDRSC